MRPQWGSRTDNCLGSTEEPGCSQWTQCGLFQKSGAVLSQYVHENLVLRCWENFIKGEKIKTKKCAWKILPLLSRFDKKYFITNWNSGRSVISRPTIPGKLRCSKIKHWRELCYLVSSSVKCQPGEWISGILHLSCRNYILYLPPCSSFTLPSSLHSFLFKLVSHGGLMVMCLHGNSLDWKGKLVLVGLYLHLETENIWGGRDFHSPALAWGRVAFIGHTKTSKDRGPQILSNLTFLCFHSHCKEFSPYGLTEFPRLQLFFPVIVIHSITILPINRQVYFVFFLTCSPDSFPLC